MFLFGWFVFWSHLKVGVALELNCEQLFKISRACLQPSSYFQTVSYSLYKSLARFDVQYDFRKHYSFSHLIF